MDCEALHTNQTPKTCIQINNPDRIKLQNQTQKQNAQIRHTNRLTGTNRIQKQIGKGTMFSTTDLRFIEIPITRNTKSIFAYENNTSFVY